MRHTRSGGNRSRCSRRRRRVNICPRGRSMRQQVGGLDMEQCPPDPSATYLVDGFRPSSRVPARWGPPSGDVQTYSAIPPSDRRRLPICTECQWEPRSSWREEPTTVLGARSRARHRTACTHSEERCETNCQSIYAHAISLASVVCPLSAFSGDGRSRQISFWKCGHKWL
jgi:hypothetical protein